MAGLDGIEMFVKVVELAGMSAAARATGVAKSSVSREIARLEARLGVRLLQRSTRAIKLTQAGAEYYARCVAIIAEAEAAERAVSQVVQAPRGLLRITATVGFGARYLAPLVAEYMAAYPDVRVELRLLDRRVNLIEEGFDLAIRMGALEDFDLDCPPARCGRARALRPPGLYRTTRRASASRRPPAAYLSLHRYRAASVDAGRKDCHRAVAPCLQPRRSCA